MTSAQSPDPALRALELATSEFATLHPTPPGCPALLHVVHVALDKR